MPEDIPPAPPEAEVIRLARRSARLTPAEAAVRVRAAGGQISDSYWRDTERGRGGRRGRPVPSRASAERLAQMAAAVGVTPEQLHAAARDHPEGEARARGVEDAARVLEEMLRREAAAADASVTRLPVRPPAPDPADGGWLPSLDAATMARAKPIADSILMARGDWRARYAAEHPGIEVSEIPEPPGSELFGDSPDDAGIWDRRAGVMTVPERANLIAVLRAREASRQESGTG